MNQVSERSTRVEPEVNELNEVNEASERGEPEVNERGEPGERKRQTAVKNRDERGKRER